MLLSELIQELESFLEEAGDVQVMILDSDELIKGKLDNMSINLVEFSDSDGNINGIALCNDDVADKLASD